MTTRRPAVVSRGSSSVALTSAANHRRKPDAGLRLDPRHPRAPDVDRLDVPLRRANEGHEIARPAGEAAEERPWSGGLAVLTRRKAEADVGGDAGLLHERRVASNEHRHPVELPERRRAHVAAHVREDVPRSVRSTRPRPVPWARRGRMPTSRSCSCRRTGPRRAPGPRTSSPIHCRALNAARDVQAVRTERGGIVVVACEGLARDIERAAHGERARCPRRRAPGARPRARPRGSHGARAARARRVGRCRPRVPARPPCGPRATRSRRRRAPRLPALRRDRGRTSRVPRATAPAPASAHPARGSSRWRTRRPSRPDPGATRPSSHAS